MSPDLKPGISTVFDYTVPDSKTVPQLYPEWREFREMPEVFATGFLVGLMEGVCQLAIKPYLDWPREQSLGNARQFLASGRHATRPDHPRALRGDRGKVRFQASAHDGHDLISEGTHERFVIDVARFREKLGPKQRAAGR